MRIAGVLFLLTTTALAESTLAQSTLAQSTPGWVVRSNENSQLLLRVMAKYSPEDASGLGLTGFDDKISRPSLEEPKHQRDDTSLAITELRTRLATEQDPLVKQDLQILIDAGEQQNQASAAYESHVLLYFNAAREVFSGVHGLLDDQVAADRRPAAVIRLKRYTGMETGYTPLLQTAENLFRAKIKDASLIGPPKAEVEQDITTLDETVEGVGQLFAKYKLGGYQDAYALLQKQATEYKHFLQAEVLPRARTDFRLPPELYAINLKAVGVDYTPAELKEVAHRTFTEIQGQMQEVSARVAKEHHFSSSDYRDVIRQLKKDQLKPDQVMPVYHQTLASIEEAIRRNHLVTLPDRPCVVRVASAAETAQQPAPHYTAPQLINNQGQQGQFVLPGGTVGSDGKRLEYDDFTFTAASWTLTAHEGRPGHDLQFSSMVQRGVSQARAIFAFNSTNVEGWALYAEYFMLPYMPDDSKLISLQFRLLRAARAFLDPELQEGKVTREQAFHVLEDEVVGSKAFATEEVDRFTFRSPGQAVSYFDGYTRLLEIRAEAEKAMGSRFDAQRFHDFVLSQGLLPPTLLRKAVMTDFVGKS